MTPRVSSEDTRSCQLALPQVRSSWIAWLRLCLPDFFLYCKDTQKHSDNSLLVPWQKSLPKSIRFERSDLRACMHAQSLSPVRLFATPWTVAHQAPLSMGFSRQEYWSGLPCPPPEGLPNLGVKPASQICSTSQFLTIQIWILLSFQCFSIY